LLDSIGTAKMQREIENRVISLTKQKQDRMTEETGIQSSLSEEDMKQYLQQVIKEVKGKAADNTKG
jgi:Tfp pilus assembly PilM family ATPase